ncbi:LysR family transcriptional regulator [Vibrio sinaloensis]|uniref:LysR family transcriptional regulator n=1 Tax=Photobacterium sp. (strain ATCC 43367) TaxID=379097 RepID=UPI00057F9C2B|nr:LysR family transcriptional regulator [Vibrio sinaloensis]KHT51814.1 LysR family transcriptional regulator [Vibrio sinaloensis]
MHDLNALHVLVTLLNTRSTQRAAKKLGRSQSYVSKVLAQLREELDDPLFVRDSSGLMPTDYALSIEPRIKNALEQLDLALAPEEFDPSKLNRVTLHIVEPYLVEIGKDLVQAIRAQTNAVIELRQWSEHSESQILDDQVDLGLHVLNDKPQSFYQKKIHSGSGIFEGNQEGEYVKFIISGINEHHDHFKALDPNLEASIVVDSVHLINQLMDDCFTLRYEPYYDDKNLSPLNLDMALICKASLRSAPKQQWLMDLIIPIVDTHVAARKKTRNQ